MYDDYVYPPDEILARSKDIPTEEQKEADANQIIDTLIPVCSSNGAGVLFDSFKYGASTLKIYLDLRGVRVSKIKNLLPDLSSAVGGDVTLENPTDIPGHIALHVPQKMHRTITFGDYMDMYSGNWFEKDFMSFPLGNGYALDLNEYPHLLIAGASGSGKSVCINAIIMGLIYRNHPSKIEFMMIDPKQVELTVYNGIPHVFKHVITDVQEAVDALDLACNEMERRYCEYSKVGVRNEKEYRQKTGDGFKDLVIIIDELADLMITSKKTVERYIVRLAQKARACNIHLIIATQEPTVNVVTGLIKANIPNRIAFKTATSKESVVILGHGGAEKLTGKGDMLFQSADSAGTPMRLQGVYVSTDDVENAVNYIKRQYPNIEKESANKSFSPKQKNLQAIIQDVDKIIEKNRQDNRRNRPTLFDRMISWLSA